MVFETGRPKWVRPVSNTPSQEIATNLANNIKLCDVISFENGGHVGVDYQSENYLMAGWVFEQHPEMSFKKAYLSKLVDNEREPFIFGNKAKAVHHDNINKLTKSLLLLEVQDASLINRIYESDTKPKPRLLFSYNGCSYDLPVTDPNYWGLQDQKLEAPKIYLTVSLGQLHDGWHNKLVAGIILV